MARRHAPIPALTVEMVPVYRCGSRGRRRLATVSAYNDAARDAIREAYADEVADQGSDWGRGGPLPPSDAYDSQERYEAIVARLARWLRWRDGRIAAMRAAP